MSKTRLIHGNQHNPISAKLHGQRHKRTTTHTNKQTTQQHIASSMHLRQPRSRNTNACKHKCTHMQTANNQTRGWRAFSGPGVPRTRTCTDELDASMVYRCACMYTAAHTGYMICMPHIHDTCSRRMTAAPPMLASAFDQSSMYMYMRWENITPGAVGLSVVRGVGGQLWRRQ